MKNKAMALWLAVVTAFALSAMAASAATAQTPGHLDFGAAGGADEGTLTISETGGGENNFFSVFGETVDCNGESTYTGHKVLTHEQTTAEAEHELLTDGATTITVTPHYKQIKEGKSNCRSGGGLPMTITMNGCDYVFHTGITTGEGEGTYGVTADVVCPPGKVIEVHVYGGEAHGFSVCTLTVGSQTGLQGPHLTNTGEDVDIDGTFTGIAVQRHGLCGPGTETVNNGTLRIDATIEAHDEIGDPIKGQIVD